MSVLFINILKMSVTASYVALVVMITRLFLKKAPKIFSYVLWSAVLFRLVCPFSFGSAFSFFNVLESHNNFIPQNIGVLQQSNTAISVGGIDSAVYTYLPPITSTASEKPIEIIMNLAVILWLVILGGLLLYSLISYLKTKNRVKHATLVKNNVFETDRISTPFVLGFIHPKIYIPSHITPSELSFVLQHEQTHIKRFDYLIKPLAFLALSLHWFNPLMWLCFSLMTKDMEMSCDESVIKHTDMDIRGSYSKSLFSLSVKQSGFISPLAFGESNVKSRIKNILKYKKLSYWITKVVLIAVIVIAVFLVSNTVKHDVPKIYINTENGQSAETMIGTYGWDYGNQQVESDSQLPSEFEYTLQNTVKVQQGEQLSLSNQKLKRNKKSPFTLLDIRIWDIDKNEIEEKQDPGTIINGDLYINTPKESGEYIYSIHLEYVRGNVYYGFKVVVLKDVVLKDAPLKDAPLKDTPLKDAPFKGLELYVWKNKEVTGKSDTYYTLLLGTNRNKEESEIYDLNLAVDSIDKLNDMLDGYSTEAELFIYQINEADFTKVEMQTIIDNIKFPKVNGTKSIGLWGATTAIEDVISIEIASKVTKNLKEIMSSPKTSSNPTDYITNHQREYETILKDGEEALNYLLSQFESGDNDNLRGQIMMRLCKDLLGERNNVSDESFSPQEWFKALSIREEIKLADFVYSGNDPIEKIVYDAAMTRYSLEYDGFTVIAPTIHGSYEKENKLKIFATIYSNQFKLYDKTLSDVGGSVTVVEITCTKNEDGSYTLVDYTESLDGSYWNSSIEEFCTMPNSKKEIKGLAKKIVDDYASNQGRSELLLKNLKEHLKANNQHGITLKQLNGELIPLN